MRRALFLVNWRAPLGSQPIYDVRGLLQRGGIELVDAMARPDEVLSDLIKRRANGCDMVIVGGGDGTLNAAAPGLVEASLPVGGASSRYGERFCADHRSATQSN
jgi:diacylglycerol kinase (ATP)